MNTEFRRAVIPKEVRSLIAFDRRAFHRYPADWFDRAAWSECMAWWLLIDGKKIGCCAFAAHADFEEHPHTDSLYIVSTGLLPAYQGSGFGSLFKAWQLCYARENGYSRIVTNSRQNNKPMIELNRKFGFRVTHTIPGYYRKPTEATIVMEAILV